MIFFGHVTPAGVLELDYPELYNDLLKGRLANCRVQLDIDRKKTPRSHHSRRICGPPFTRPSRGTQVTQSPRCMKSVRNCSWHHVNSQSATRR
jgi:hypothetical protein